MERKEILAISIIALILLSTVASAGTNSSVFAQPNERNAILTGKIYDYGVDTDADGLFDFLVVEVEVQVYVPKSYRVEVEALRDAYYKSVDFKSSNQTYLDSGLHNVSLSFNGMAICGNELNATHVTGVSLSYEEGTSHYTQIIAEIALSVTYTYTLFDSGAILTGTLYDEGTDADGDGLFDHLQIGVEINVKDTALYRVSVSGLVGVSGYNYSIDISNSTMAFFSPGIQILNVSLHGTVIFASHTTDISKIGQISLEEVVAWMQGYQFFLLDYKNDLPLNKAYSYEQFETPAYFTGTISDVGIDNDGDSKFDYLQISIGINVTEAGNYAVNVQTLVDNASNAIYIYETVVWVANYFALGVNLVNLTVYGPRIYALHLNPMYIGEMILCGLEFGLILDSRSNVPLPTLYNYTDFESHAFLTGKVSDRGVDVDGDGLFDYLEIGVEINVTEAGRYAVSAGELLEQVNGMYNRTLYVYKSMEADFDVGVHTVHLNYEGPRLAYEHFSPTSITKISLYEPIYPYVQLGYITSAPLSKRYDYTLFNTPLKDMQVNFNVYPNGTIDVDGTFNFTHMYPQNIGPLINTTLSFSTLGETTRGSVNGTLVFPRDGMFRWPFDSTTASFASKYENGLLNTTLDATLFMPPEGLTTYPTNSSDFSFNSTYSNGMLNVELRGETEIPSYASMFPFNTTDLTVLADYVGNEIIGNITFHTISGFPLGDVMVYFNGNKTDLYLNGNLTVIYGNYFDMEINAVSLEEMLNEFNSTIPGPWGLVYNMTWGLLECTQLNTAKTPLFVGSDEYGAKIEYNVKIHGNFTGFFARLLAQMASPYDPETAYPSVYAALDSALSSVQSGSLLINYYHVSGKASIDLHLASDVKVLWEKALQLVPPTMPPEYRTQVEALIKIQNATAHNIKNFSLNASYSSITQKLDLDAWFLVNATELEKDMISFLPEAEPPELREIMRSYVSTTYCNLTSSNTTVNYVNGTADFEINWVLQGDYKAQVNHIKSFYVGYLNATAPWMLGWQLPTLNETEIDINNFSAEVKMGEDWMYLTFNGLIIQPPKDEIDFIKFKFYQLFNMTMGPYESPRGSERLKVTVRGATNATHMVLLSAPQTVPSADEFSLDYKSMIWENTTLSSLKDLVFQVANLEEIDYLGRTFHVPIFTNSTVSNFDFNPDAKRISFNVSGATGTGFCNITIPRSLLYAALGEWSVKIDGTQLPPENFTVTENAEYVFIYVSYFLSSHLIEIEGTSVIPEFPPNMLSLILIISSLIVAVIAVKQRKKLGTLKTRYQGAIHTFASKLH